MKNSTILLGFTVWSASLALAYWIGTSTQTPNAPATDAIPKTGPVRTTETAAVETITEEERETLVDESSQLEAFFNGENPSLEDALQEVSSLSAEEARTLLVDAFALPKSDPNRSRMIRELLGQLAETEPLAALELAEQIGSLRDTERARATILETWGRNDPTAAVSWASTALADEPSRSRNALITAIYEGYAETNPGAAFQRAMLITDDTRLRDRVLGEVIETQIRNGGLNAAMLTVNQMGDGELQDTLRRELVDEWAEFDPAAAAAYVGSLGEDASTRVRSALVSEWAESDPAAAAAWLSSLPEDDPAIAQASASIIREWTRYDLAASAEWLNSLPASEELDRAVISYTFRAAEEDPGTAMTWAESIGSERRRNWMMERVAASWKEQSPEAFQAYLNDSELSDEQRKRMENAQPGRGGWGR